METNSTERLTGFGRGSEQIPSQAKVWENEGVSWEQNSPGRGRASWRHQDGSESGAAGTMRGRVAGEVVGDEVVGPEPQAWF